MALQELKEIIGLLRGKREVLQELERSLQAKVSLVRKNRPPGGMTPEEKDILRDCWGGASLGFFLAWGSCGWTVWKALGGNKRTGAPLLQPGPLRFGLAAGSALLTGRLMYYSTLHAYAKKVLDLGEERMKMELANIILTKHSDEKSLVEAVKRHFFAEYLFNYQHQDRPVFRWRPRHLYIDSAFMERVKEIEANNSDDEARSISRQTTRSFGDLMEDPLDCILSSPDSNMECSKPHEHTGTTLKRRELSARRRSHRHHHRHADKLAAL